MQTLIDIPRAYLNLAYLLAAVLFIYGLKGLCRPRSAVRGNLLGALGMLIAVLATVPYMLEAGYGPGKPPVSAFSTIGIVVAAVAIGSVIGALLALKIRMTAMPQMVALLNGFGGGASVLVAGAEQLANGGPATPLVVAIATVASGIIGAVTFWGSLVAFAKLEEYKAFKKPYFYPGLKTDQRLLGHHRHRALRLRRHAPG